MKCDYCENEIGNPINDKCPFCGAPVQAHETHIISERHAPEGQRVACPHCGEQIVVDELKYASSGKCTSCGADCSALIPPKEDNEVADVGKKSVAVDSPQIEKIKTLIANLRRENIFSGIDVSDYGFMPTAGEVVYEVVDDITLNETRSIRRSHTEKTGSSVYDYEGNSESKTHYEFQVVTNGNLFLTNKRVVFTGGQQVRNIKFDDIVSFESDWKRDEGAIQISSSKRTKAMRFTGADIFKFTLIYNAIRSAKFRNLFEKGPDKELIEKFVEVGLFYTPPPIPVETPPPANSSQDEEWKGVGCLLIIIIGAILFAIIAANAK